MDEKTVTQEHIEKGWSVFTDDGFISLAGPFFHKREDSGPTFRFPALHKHHNRNGFLQGGALMTFTDRALGATAREMTDTPRTATVQLNMNFVDAVKIGEVVQVSPTVVRATRQLIFMSGTLMVDARVIAVCTGMWKKILWTPE